MSDPMESPPKLPENFQDLAKQLSEKMDGVVENIREVKAVQNTMHDKIERIVDRQANQASEILTIRTQAEHAVCAANDAKRAAGDAAAEVNNMVQAIQQHVAGVEKTLVGHDKRLDVVNKTLETQNEVLDKQTEDLQVIVVSDIRREEREKASDKFSRAQWGFVRLALPLGFTVMVALISLVVWLVEKLR